MTKYIRLLSIILIIQFFGINGCAGSKVDQDEIKKANNKLNSISKELSNKNIKLISGKLSLLINLVIKPPVKVMTYKFLILKN